MHTVPVKRNTRTKIGLYKRYDKKLVHNMNPSKTLMKSSVVNLTCFWVGFVPNAQYV